jgi:glycosyltransferase involved in cell wall biosynthesis
VGQSLAIHVVTRLNVGGPTRQIASLMRRMPARFAQILVAGKAQPGEGEGVLDVPGERIRLDSLVRPVSPLADRRAFGDLVRIFRERRPAIVQTHQGKAGWVGRAAAAATGVPVIVHLFHGHTFRGYFRWPMSMLVRRFERRGARVSSALIAQAPSQAEDLAHFLGEETRKKTRVILPGIEMPPAGAAPPKAMPGEKRRVVFPARLEPVKDPMLALEVARRLPEGFELHVFGDGSLGRAVARILAGDPALRERVVLHPPTPEREEIFDGGAVTLLTSREEGTPLALVESQAFGVPVVAPDVGAVRSVVAPGGGLVVPRNAAALAAAVEQVARGGIAPDAVAWVRERFSAERMVAEVAALWDELLAARGDARPTRTS